MTGFLTIVGAWFGLLVVTAVAAACLVCLLARCVRPSLKNAMECPVRFHLLAILLGLVAGLGMRDVVSESNATWWIEMGLGWMWLWNVVLLYVKAINHFRPDEAG